MHLAVFAGPSTVFPISGLNPQHPQPLPLRSMSVEIKAASETSRMRQCRSNDWRVVTTDGAARRPPFGLPRAKELPLLKPLWATLPFLPICALRDLTRPHELTTNLRPPPLPVLASP